MPIMNWGRLSTSKIRVVGELGIILYCLLTGTLPFDDDDDAVMRSEIILGHFEDPVWLSLSVRLLFERVDLFLLFFSHSRVSRPY